MADLSKEANNFDKYRKIGQELERLDIAILVNNAGVLTGGYFRDVKAEAHRDCAIVNTYPYVFLTRELLHHFK